VSSVLLRCSCGQGLRAQRGGGKVFCPACGEKLDPKRDRAPALPRLNWGAVLLRAAEIVEGYEIGVTLRQLFYRLVSEEIIENTQSRYNALSSRTAAARRDGWFPSLVDNVRTIRRSPTWEGPEEAIDALRSQYRRDRTLGQDFSVYVAVEKAALAGLLASWFREEGVGVLALGGYASQSYVDEVIADVAAYGRPAILIYGGDFDPSGIDLQRDFEARTDCWEHVERVALTPEQIVEFDLPPLPGKASDSRSAAFELEHGRLIQVELDALPPDSLRDLYRRAFDRFWEPDVYADVLAREIPERERLRLAAA
jgi:hypothetical protein